MKFQKRWHLTWLFFFWLSVFHYCSFSNTTMHILMTIYPNCESSYKISFGYSTHFLCCSCIYSNPDFQELLKTFNILTMKNFTGPQLLQTNITIIAAQDFLRWCWFCIAPFILQRAASFTHLYRTRTSFIRLHNVGGVFESHLNLFYKHLIYECLYWGALHAGCWWYKVVRWRHTRLMEHITDQSLYLSGDQDLWSPLWQKLSDYTPGPAPHGTTEPASLNQCIAWRYICGAFSVSVISPVLILSGLPTPEAKPETPAWYENILQIIILLQGKWVYKNVSLIPSNKIWAFITRRLLNSFSG